MFRPTKISVEFTDKPQARVPVGERVDYLSAKQIYSEKRYA